MKPILVLAIFLAVVGFGPLNAQTINIKSGKIDGIKLKNGVHAYYGIPFARKSLVVIDNYVVTDEPQNIPATKKGPKFPGPFISAGVFKGCV